MAFTADLLRLLNRHPEWKAELRRHVLSDELQGLRVHAGTKSARRPLWQRPSPRKNAPKRVCSMPSCSVALRHPINPSVPM